MAGLYAFFWVIWAVGICLVLAYGAVLLFGAPYFPTLKKPLESALDLLDLKKGQVVYDLGCGDGRFLKAAAMRELKAVGYELNPFMFLYSWATTRKYGRQVQVRFGNFWKADISEADGIFIFLLDKYMPRLDAMIRAKGKAHVKLASHAFKIPGKKSAAQKSAVFLYKY